MIRSICFNFSRVGCQVRNAQRMEDCMALYAETAKGDAL
jgi:hypothetical protein